MKVAIFDFDGTLFDSGEYWTEIISEYLLENEVEVPVNVFGIVKPLGIRGAIVRFNQIYGFQEDIDTIVKRWRSKMGVHYQQEIPLKRRSEEYLRMLKAAGVKICMATAMERDFIDGAIDRCGIRKYFDYIVTIEDIKVDKSTPKIFEVCAEKFSANKEECVVYEDNPKAIKMCHQAGFKTIGVFDGVCVGDKELMTPYADYCIENFDELMGVSL